MVKHVSLVILLAQSLSFGSDIVVKLNAPDSIIRHRSGTVLFGVKYADGTVSATELFSVSELQAGVTSKPFSIDDSKTMTSCEYQWGIMSNPPGDPTEQPDFLLPVSLGGALTLRKACVIDLVTRTSILDITPFQLQGLKVSAYKSSLQNNDANTLFSSFSIVGASDTYAGQTLQMDTQSTDPVKYSADVLVREPVKAKVENLWFLTSGNTKTENFESSSLQIEIR